MLGIGAIYISECFEEMKVEMMLGDMYVCINFVQREG